MGAATGAGQVMDLASVSAGPGEPHHPPRRRDRPSGPLYAPGHERSRRPHPAWCPRSMVSLPASCTGPRVARRRWWNRPLIRGREPNPCGRLQDGATVVGTPTIVQEAGTPLAVPLSTMRSRFNWPVGKVAGVLCGHALDDRARGTIRSTAWYGQMTQPRHIRINPRERC